MTGGPARDAPPSAYARWGDLAMSVVLHSVDRPSGPSSNGPVPSFVVTAADREWFGRCRPGLGPRAPAGAGGLEPVDGRAGPAGAGPGHACGPRGPLLPRHVGLGPVDRRPARRRGLRARRRPAGGPSPAGGLPDAGPPASTSSPRCGWRPISTCRVPDPGAARRPTWPRPTGSASVYQRSHRASCSSTTRTSGSGSATTGWSTTSPIRDELALDERLLTACWAWERDRAGHSPVVGVQYTELRLDPAELRRTVGAPAPRRRSAAPRPASARPVPGDARPDGRRSSPRPAWTHCALVRRSGRPCLAMEPGRGRRRPAGRRATAQRPPDVLEEGRLGRRQLGHGPRRRTAALRLTRRPVTRHARLSGVMSALTTAECTIRGRDGLSGAVSVKAAMAAWPTLMPPSFGGTRAVHEHGQPGRARARSRRPR